MIPGAGERRGPVPGYRPVGSFRNGMPESASRGYRFKGIADWGPYQGNHLDPAVVKAEGRQLPPSRGRSRAEKLAEYSEAREAGFTLPDAAEYTGIAVSTAEKYERDYQAARDGVPAGGGS